MEERQQRFWSLMKKTAEDEEFRAAVIADPRAAIGREFGIGIPENVEIVVHENDAGTVHLPLTAKPEVLSEGDMRQVTGGGWNLWGCAKCF